MHGISSLSRLSNCIDMESREDSSKFGSFSGVAIRTLSSSSSAFFSANQSPFFSPRSPTCQSSRRSDVQCDDVSPVPPTCTPSDLHKMDHVSSSTGISTGNLSIYNTAYANDHSSHREKQKRVGRSYCARVKV